MKTICILFLSFIFVHGNWKIQRENLDKVYILDEFRVFYTLTGKDALPFKNQVDLNKNEIPDYIENIAQRLKVSKDIFTNILGFKNPLKTSRYKDVKFIDIHILKSKNSSSGDGIVFFNYKALDSRENVISMKIRNDLSKSTMTPSHEYFHLLQNSYSMFKNKWYTEGTARWAERVFKKGTGKRAKLPQNIDELKTLLKQSYETKGFWRKLAYICDTNNGHFNNEKDYKTTVINYPSLVEDNRIYGYEFMRVFLENLDYQDNIASKKRGFSEFKWQENEQRNNTNNNEYILKALKETINNVCKNKNELYKFKNLLDLYIKGQK